MTVSTWTCHDLKSSCIELQFERVFFKCIFHNWNMFTFFSISAGEDRDTCTYENLPIRRSRRMQLPQIPTQKTQHSPVELGDNSHHHQRSQHIQQQQHHQHHQQQRRRRLLPQINTATYTKKVADLNQRSSPMGILPVGYPVFLPCTNEEDSSLIEDQMSPVNMLPDPAAAPDSGLQLHGLNNDEQNKVGAPLRQSPASSIPPVLPDLKEDTIRYVLCYIFFPVRI